MSRVEARHFAWLDKRCAELEAELLAELQAHAPGRINRRMREEIRREATLAAAADFEEQYVKNPEAFTASFLDS